MKLSNRQKALLHSVPAALGIDEAQRRLIQQNVGGFYSAADRTCSRQGFIAVMAFYEQRSGGPLRGFTPGYWSAEDRDANPADALRYRVRRMAAEMGLPADELDRFIAGKHMSSGACAGLDDAGAYWLRSTIEALKVIRRRGQRRAV